MGSPLYQRGGEPINSVQDAYPRRAVFTALVLLAFASGAPAAVQYNVTDLSELLGRPVAVNDINDAGHLTGYYYSPDAQAFLYDGTFRDLGGTAPFEVGNALNNRGEVVGYYAASRGALGQGFVYSGGTMSEVPGLPGSVGSNPDAINDTGTIVGRFFRAEPGDPGPTPPGRPFVRQGGVTTQLLAPVGPGWGNAWSINNRGTIVGFVNTTTGVNDSRAFTWSNGTMTLLGTLGGATSAAVDINESGQIVGSSETADGVRHAFLHADGVMRDLGSLGGESLAWEINEAGDAVGFSFRADGTTRVAVLYRGGQAIDLNTLVDPARRLFLQEALAINDAGEILVIAEDLSPQGRGGYFLLTPVPEPSAAGLLLALVPLAATRRRPRSGMLRGT